MSTSTVTPTPTKNESSKWNSRPRTQGSTGSSSRGSGKSKYGKKQKSRSASKPVATKPPSKEYISTCCSTPAVKPRAGKKEVAQDPESKKMKDITKGLGHWRCSACGKPTKVTPRAPQPKEVVTVHTPLDIKVPVTEAVFDTVATLPS